ncbi:prolipoprotein diacylglyceryl transferase family protein [Chondrinema litorale]|uniref:prolipoprotein diacylglyceryl transferase family protein n=1 Tax=Chondrinema litorale TaxID=2994555 RepID=UPI0025428B12|nr:prolipoprotein diacylglyceryl transferase family protein [Chondrinema litorale]UZR95608.1 prolipoprotein diacylglyceryl transferase [Chondrinema litorale]
MLDFISFVWSTDPGILELGSFFTLHWSVLVVGLGLFLAFELFYRTLSKESFPKKKSELLFGAGLLISLIGAKICATIFKGSSNIDNLTEIEFSLSGGILFLLAFCIFLTKKSPRTQLLNLLDTAVFSLLLFLTFQQASLFLEPGNWGKQTESKFGVVFTNEAESILAGVFDKIDTVQIKKIENIADVGQVPVSINIDFIDELKDQQEAETFLNKDFKKSIVFYEVFNQHVRVDSVKPLEFSINKVENQKLQAEVKAIGILRHPTMLYKALFILIVFTALIYYRNKLPKGMAAGLGILLLLLGLTTLNFLFANKFSWDVVSENSLSLILFSASAFYLVKLPELSVSKSS